MKALIGLGFGAFFLSSLAIGIRLLLLARSNRRLPELLIGLGILGIGPAGFACMVFAMLVAPAHPTLGAVMLGAALVATGIGAVSAYVFTWTVFRRDDVWAKWLVVVAAAICVVVFLGRLATGGFVLPMHIDFWFHANSINITACLLWGSAESLRYYTMMRRREAIGLADHLVTNRFLLWGLGIGAAGVGSLISVGVVMATGSAMHELDGLTLSNSLFGLASAVLMWIAFLPPAAYRRWIEARAASADAPRS
jgi:hypothetical protein